MFTVAALDFKVEESETEYKTCEAGRLLWSDNTFLLF